MNNKKIFADRLVNLRESRGVTQQTLADELKITRQSLSLYEKAERTMNIDLLVKIAQYFNVSADYLLGLNDNATTDIELKAVCDYTGLSEEAIQKLSSEKSEGFGERMDILSWLISQEYALELCNLLYEIDSASEFYESDLKTYQEKFNIFEEQIKTNNYTTVIQFDELDNLNHDLEETFDKIDVARYRLIRFTESLANLYDNRKQTNLSKAVPELLFTVNQLRREGNMGILWNYLKENNMFKKENPDNGNNNPKDE